VYGEEVGDEGVQFASCNRDSFRKGSVGISLLTF
jgi:hypothetical protein